MAKRFTGTEKWADAWFCSLTPIEKLFWVYLLDNCDNAGIWQVNWPLVWFHLPGFALTEKFKGRYIELTPEKWFIPKFIGFQYLTLNPANRMHSSVISKLQKEGVYKGLASPLQGAKDKEQEQEQDKEQEKEQEKKPLRFLKPSPSQVAEYAAGIGFALDGAAFCDYYDARGWQYKAGQPMKDWKAAVRTWKAKRQDGVPPKPAVDFN